jgi:molybdenum cofactor biosynthesis enzyme MoaA
VTAVAPSLLPVIDPTDHFRRTVFPLEHEELDECPIDIRNIGWTLGNDCPFRCSHCYSMSARKKGADMSVETIDRIVSELVRNGVETVNLGGNEPLYTNGTDARKSLLPYIIEQLVGHGILVGITTAGPSLVYLDRHHPEIFRLLNDADISFDSPIEAEHNGNRGAKLYSMAVQCLKLCQLYDIPHSIIMCGMNWNFTEDHLLALVGLAKRYEAHVRINPLKPVEPGHMASALTSDQYYAGFSLLMQRPGGPGRAADRHRHELRRRRWLPVRPDVVSNPLGDPGRQDPGLTVRLPARLQGGQPGHRRPLRHRAVAPVQVVPAPQRPP